MNFSFYIAKRYFISKNSKNAINIINGLSFAITIISALVLFIVLAGFAGLRAVSLNYLTYFDPDLRIEPAKGKTILFKPELEKQFSELNGVAHYSKTIEERVFVEYKKKSFLTNIKGVDTSYANVVDFDSIVDYGNWFNSKLSQSVIGYGIADVLSISIYDFDNPLKLIVPKPGKGQISSVKSAYNSEAVFPTGIYLVNEEIDKKYVFTPLKLAQSLLGYDNNTISAIELKVDKGVNPDHMKAKIEELFDHSVLVKNKYELNSDLYKMLNTENVASYLIGTLIVIIALFNVIGSIIMMILDKKQNLKTMHALGASVSEIKKIFFYQGVIMTTLGTIIGIVLGFILVFFQKQFSLVMITPTQPWPLNAEFSTVLIVLFTITILGILASKLASRRINKKLIADN
ncbi:MAG: ABC transporter permease [Flavobacteriaceae bacterium]|nr:ABC transporter permease [Flavobacteriaceae bacterium]